MSHGNFAHYDDETSVVYALDNTLSICYVNATWDRFAIQNGAPELAGGRATGIRVVEVLAEPIRPFYRDALNSALRRATVWEHRYNCSSADLFREFHMRVFPTADGLVVVNSCAIEHPISEPGEVTGTEYTGPGGIIRMCAHCRRTEHPRLKRWDWVRAYIASPPARCSHGLCPSCFTYYYPGA